MLTVACVEAGDYYGRGREYVAKLRAGVARHLSEPHVFRVYTDNMLRHWQTLQETGLEIVEWRNLPPSWWAKVALFRPDAFRPGDRVLYFDLDTVIVDGLDETLARASGILHLGKWGWKKNDYGSGVMAWRHGEHREVWDKQTQTLQKDFRGDQDWLTHLGGWAALPDGACVSYRYHCQKQGRVPEGAAVVCWHGVPKLHDCTEQWVLDNWRD